MKALWISLMNLRRMFRARTNIFFVFVFPLVLILVLGATFGGSSSPRLGVVSTGSGPLGTALLRQFEQTPHLRVVNVSDPAALLTQVERGNLAAGVIIPSGYDGAVRAGQDVTLRYLARPDQSSQRLGETVRGAVARQAALLGAARFAAERHAVPDFSAGLAAASRIAPSVNGCLPPLQWQTYDIDFTNAVPDANDPKKPAKKSRITCKLNGITIHDNVEIPGPTGGAWPQPEGTPGPLILQGHGNPLQFRNIWVVEKK